MRFVFQLIESCAGRWRGDWCPARARKCCFVRAPQSKILSQFLPLVEGGKKINVDRSLLNIEACVWLSCVHRPALPVFKTSGRLQSHGLRSFVFFVLLRLRWNCWEEKMISKTGLPRRVQTYLRVQVVNILLVSLPVFFLSCLEKNKSNKVKEKQMQFGLCF